MKFLVLCPTCNREISTEQERRFQCRQCHKYYQTKSHQIIQRPPIIESDTDKKYETIVIHPRNEIKYPQITGKILYD